MTKGSVTSPEEVVLGLCEAVGRHDAEALRPYFTDDVVYHNIPMEPAVGVEATIAFIDGFFKMCDRLTIDTLHLAVRDDVVLTERVDTFTLGDREAALPVMGTFEVRDGRISAWRDYFDLAQVTSMLSG